MGHQRSYYGFWVCHTFDRAPHLTVGRDQCNGWACVCYCVSITYRNSVARSTTCLLDKKKTYRKCNRGELQGWVNGLSPRQNTDLSDVSASHTVLSDHAFPLTSAQQVQYFARGPGSTCTVPACFSAIMARLQVSRGGASRNNQPCRCRE